MVLRRQLFVADLSIESNCDRIKPNTIDLILVDMMYKAEYADLYPHLARISAKLSKANRLSSRYDRTATVTTGYVSSR